ncbi:unnamed protein product [Nezara viridula]|uniref:Cell cycle checkpoint control protein RAD9A n=1 Tax=Nezara viridula TaxID=85310 RepID=A0A9P0GZZ2_NEZVI|nr:unnamed protein product [Nezara viridula]
MKCVIPSQNVKIVARAVHSLAKVGDEIFIQPAEDELLFRTINAAKSAFAEFRMCRSFFSSFSFSPPQNDTECKITMKSCINVFRSVHGMDKQVENCEIRIKPQSSQIVFQIKFINSSVKKYYLPVIENDQLEAQIPTDQPNQICASSKFLSASLKNFRHSEDEITIKVDKDSLFIKNHLELKKDFNLMRTELCYHRTEFESYVVENPTKITFCLKELRAVVMFAEPGNLPVILSFNEPGRPVVFQVMNHPAYEANYVISTLPSSRVNRSGHLTGCQNIDSPLTTPTSQGIKKNSISSTPYSFVEKESTTPISRKQDNIRSSISSTPEPIPSTSYQTSIEKSVQQFLSKPDPTKNIDKESEPSKFLLEIESLKNTSVEPVPSTINLPVLKEGPSMSEAVPESGNGISVTHGSLTNTSLEVVQSDASLPFLNEGPSTSQVVPESEPAVSISHGTPEGSLCRVDTVIKGMDSSSQPSPELLKTVFSRCFSKDHFLNVLVGHDVLLEESSDREAS